MAIKICQIASNLIAFKRLVTGSRVKKSGVKCSGLKFLVNKLINPIIRFYLYQFSEIMLILKALRDSYCWVENG